MRTIWSALMVSCFVGAIGGCQSWSQLGQGMATGSRVPAPGTGSYPVPGSYYNGQKTGAATSPAAGSTLAGTSAGAGAMGAPAPGAVTTANWQPPTPDQLRQSANNIASSAINDATNRANQVVQASTSRAAAAMEQYTNPAPATDNDPPALGASRSISDSPAPAGNEPPRLDWQAPR